MANVIFANTVLANKYDSVLTTKLDLNAYMTVDNTLAADAGMVKKVITKTVTGDVDDLEMGSGNTSSVEVGTTSKDYTVTTTQGRFAYYDEEAMQDPAVVEAGLTGLSEKMVNSFVKKAIAEWEKATLSIKGDNATGITFDNVVDALAKLNLESEQGLFMLVSPSMVAQLRKNLGESLSYSEGFVRTGYIGTVCGVPVIVSKAVGEKAILASREAVTLFIKKNSEIEQDRDPDKRQNTVYARKVALVALTDATKVVLIDVSAEE